MPRIARVVAVDQPHHIAQRGNNKQDVFRDDHDRELYLLLVEEYCKKYRSNILGYCLMSNHVHFVMIPEEEDSLAKVFNLVQMRYAQYYNKKMGFSGHLWHGRYFSCILDERHLLVGLRYIERNPVRSGLVQYPWNWKWSSAAYHIGLNEKSYLTLKSLHSYINMTNDEWKSYINEKEDEESLFQIRNNTRLGKPLGSERFIMQLEKNLHKSLKSFPRGRPKKVKVKKR
jgi:putative transposase